MRLPEQGQESEPYSGEANSRVNRPLQAQQYRQERQSLERHQSSIASIVSAVDTLTCAVEE